MKITVHIDDELMSKAVRVTGIEEIDILVRLGLETLISTESGKILAALGGTEKDLTTVPRRGSF